MDEAEIRERLASVEARAKSNTHQIDELKPVVGEIHTMSKTMVQLVSEVKHTNESVAEIKEKVETMEQEPAKKWKDSTKAIFNAFLGAIGTAVAGGLLYLMMLAK